MGTLASNCRYLPYELLKSLLNLTLEVLIVQMGLHKGIGILLFTVGHHKTYGKCLTKNTPIAKQTLHLFEHQPMACTGLLLTLMLRIEYLNRKQALIPSQQAVLNRKKRR